ncbi:UNVERIFIED_CONTAM: hypothetical protein HDU68_002279 [Siphonaria sp. JEL0065]|nr:hypothetical protein HDU68_002279 [Siphonaria sp. JEL0065]
MGYVKSLVSITKVEFFPDAESKPFKSKAVITMYSSSSVDQAMYDYHLADTLILAYSLLHDPLTRINDEEDVEFVVAYTGNLGVDKRDAFIALGARLLHLQELQTPNTTETYKTCRSCFSKLYLFGLEGIYTDIIYLESNIYIAKPTTSLFSFSYNQNLFFGAVPVLELSEIAFDSSVMILQPSLAQYHRLLSRYQQTDDHDTYYMEHKLLNDYFKEKGPSCLRWNNLPSVYNVQHPQLRDATQLSIAIAIQHDFWTTKSDKGPSRAVYNAWRLTVKRLYNFQVSRTNGHSLVGVIPNKFEDLEVLVKANMVASRIVIYSLLVGAKELLNRERVERVTRNRERYIAEYSNMFHFWQHKTDHSMPVWQKAEDAEVLLRQYDWIWLLDAGDAMIMNKDVDLRVLLGRLILEGKRTDAVAAALEENHDHEHAAAAGEIDIDPEEEAVVEEVAKQAVGDLKKEKQKEKVVVAAAGGAGGSGSDASPPPQLDQLQDTAAGKAGVKVKHVIALPAGKNAIDDDVEKENDVDAGGEDFNGGHDGGAPDPIQPPSKNSKGSGRRAPTGDDHSSHSHGLHKEQHYEPQKYIGPSLVLGFLLMLLIDQLGVGGHDHSHSMAIATRKNSTELPHHHHHSGSSCGGGAAEEKVELMNSQSANGSSGNDRLLGGGGTSSATLGLVVHAAADGIALGAALSSGIYYFLLILFILV